MKVFKLITIALLFPLLIAGCMSREERYYRDKALELIKKDLVNALDDYDSYEPIETDISRLRLDFIGDTLIQNLIKEIRNADSVVALRHNEEREAYRIVRLTNYSIGDSEKRHYEALIKWGKIGAAKLNAEDKRLVLVDSILPLVDRQESRIYGWRVNHRIRYKGKGYPKVCDYTYYLDKDCNHILLKIDEERSWSDDDIEFATRIYEEALERKKENK